MSPAEVLGLIEHHLIKLEFEAKLASCENEMAASLKRLRQLMDLFRNSTSLILEFVKTSFRYFRCRVFRRFGLQRASVCTTS